MKELVAASAISHVLCIQYIYTCVKDTLCDFTLH